MDIANQTSLSDLLCDIDGAAGAVWQGDVDLRGNNAWLVAEAEWRAAIAALTALLPTLPRSASTSAVDDTVPTGLALSGPLPVLNESDFEQGFESWVVTPQPLASALQGQQHSLLPAGKGVPSKIREMQVLPLNITTPLLNERFCLVMTPAFSIALVLGQPTGGVPQLQYSFDPVVLTTLWQHIREDISAIAHHHLGRLEAAMERMVSAPDFRAITRFTQTLMANLPHRLNKHFLASEDRGHLRFTRWSDGAAMGDRAFGKANSVESSVQEAVATSVGEETELLQAMAHEIRTPLTTIRTLTRSLMRRKDISAEVKKRLHRIDAECTQQIDRFNLIFRAVELENSDRDRHRSLLTPIALTQIFSEAIPRWQQQAQRRNLKLDVSLPPDLPRVTSDPTLLNEVLTGVVEWFTQCLPPQSHVHMTVMLAGHQLKLQFEASSLDAPCGDHEESGSKRQPLKSVGQLLTIVPDTGGVSLNLDVTKNLFEFLGGKLILRQRPEQGDVLTAFLPLDTREV